MQGKNVVIVGGTSGIGKTIVKRLLDAGADVLNLSRSNDDNSDNPALHHQTFDAVADPFPADALPEKIDGLVYCPGSIRLRPFARLRDEEFEADFRLNVLGAVKSIQACLPKMKKAEGVASIVLFSTVAVQTGMPFHASVAAAKGAIEGMTRSLAAELAPRIRVNTVAPSLTDTPLAGGLLADDKRRQAAAERHPLGRIGETADIAQAVLFLLGDSGGWVTGQIISVDGGIGSTRIFR